MNINESYLKDPQGSMLFDDFTMTSSVSLHFEKESWCCVRDFVITLVTLLSALLP